MDETRFAEDLLLRIGAGEFDGRLYQTILNLSEAERKQIITLATQHVASEPNRSAGPAPHSNTGLNDERSA